MQVNVYKKTGRNEICPCQPTVKRTVTNQEGQEVTFHTHATGAKKFKHCHGANGRHNRRKQTHVNDNAELNIHRRAGRIGAGGI